MENMLSALLHRCVSFCCQRTSETPSPIGLTSPLSAAARRSCRTRQTLLLLPQQNTHQQQQPAHLQHQRQPQQVWQQQQQQPSHLQQQRHPQQQCRPQQVRALQQPSQQRIFQWQQQAFRQQHLRLREQQQQQHEECLSCCCSFSGLLHCSTNINERQQQMRVVCGSVIGKPQVLPSSQRRFFFWKVPAAVAAALLPAIPSSPPELQQLTLKSNNSSRQNQDEASAVENDMPPVQRFRGDCSSRNASSTREYGSSSNRNSSKQQDSSSSSDNTPLSMFIDSAADEQILRHTERRIVGTAAETYFAVVRDVGKYDEFIPWIKGSRVLRPEECSSRSARYLHQLQLAAANEGEEREVFAAELVIGFKFLSDRYTSIVSVKRPSPSRAVSSRLLPTTCCLPTTEAAGTASLSPTTVPLLQHQQQQQQQHTEKKKQQQNEQQQHNQRPPKKKTNADEAATISAPFEISVRAADSNVFKTLETKWSFWPCSSTTPEAITSLPPQQQQQQPCCCIAFSIAFEFRSILHQSFAAAFLREMAAAVGRCFDSRVSQLTASYPNTFSPSSSLPPSSCSSSHSLSSATSSAVPEAAAAAAAESDCRDVSAAYTRRRETAAAEALRRRKANKAAAGGEVSFVAETEASRTAATLGMRTQPGQTAAGQSTQPSHHSQKPLSPINARGPAAVATETAASAAGKAATNTAAAQAAERAPAAATTMAGAEATERAAAAAEATEKAAALLRGAAGSETVVASSKGCLSSRRGAAGRESVLHRLERHHYGTAQKGEEVYREACTSLCCSPPNGRKHPQQKESRRAHASEKDTTCIEQSQEKQLNEPQVMIPVEEQRCQARCQQQRVMLA